VWLDHGSGIRKAATMADGGALNDLSEKKAMTRIMREGGTAMTS